MKNLRVQTQTYFQKKSRNFFSVLLTGLVMASWQSAAAMTQAVPEKPVAFTAPNITKSFNPSSIMADEFVSLVIVFSNPNAEAAAFTAPFIEKLPTGIVIVGSASTTCGGTLTAEAGSSKITLTDAGIPAYSACQILLGVKASKAGRFESKTPIAALQTDKGSNSAVNDATLTVIRPAAKDLRIRKSFNPASIKLNEYTTLSIAISNPNSEATRLTVPFRDYLPEGMVILGSASTSCEGRLTAKPGTSKIILDGAKIPAHSACEVLLGVTARENKGNISGLIQTDPSPQAEQPTANLTGD